MKMNKSNLIAMLLIASLMSGCSVSGGNGKMSGELVESTISKEASTVEYADIDSKVLGKTLGVNIYLPAGYDSKKDYPVLYLLHGFGGGRYDWLSGYHVSDKMDILLRTDLAEPGIIVCPDLKNSYGVNSFDGPAKVVLVPDGNENIVLNYGRYEDYIVQELIPYIEKTYSVSKKKEGRYIGGFSMGAHTALRLGFTYPDMFSKIGGHAPSLRQLDVDMSPMIQEMIYPTQALREQRDPLYLAKSASLKNMEVYLDIGSEDMENKARQLATEDLVKTLQEAKVPCEYYLNPGNHSGDYISANATKYLSFYFGK